MYITEKNYNELLERINKLEKQNKELFENKLVVQILETCEILLPDFREVQSLWIERENAYKKILDIKQEAEKRDYFRKNPFFTSSDPRLTDDEVILIKHYQKVIDDNDGRIEKLRGEK